MIVAANREEEKVAASEMKKNEKAKVDTKKPLIQELN